jgi:hypothetical protein
MTSNDDLSLYPQVYYNTREEAIMDAKAGNLVGVIDFSENYTKAFEERMDFGRDTDDDVIDLTEIPIWMDMSSECYIMSSSCPNVCDVSVELDDFIVML